MFILYNSNSPELLNEIAFKIIQRYKLKNIYQPDIFLVQNIDLIPWIKLKFFKNFNFHKNIKFFLLENFIWKMLLNKPLDFSKTNTQTIYFLTWHLIEILPKISKKESEYIYQKLYNCNENELFLFSYHIANIFYKYLLYRSDWLELWKKEKKIENLGSHQHWQSMLWRKLIKKYKIDKKFLTKNIIDNFFLKNFKENHQSSFKFKVPNRIFVFGTSSLIPIHLNILHILGKYIDIHFLFVNPCCCYWEDICDNDFFMKSIYKIYENYQKYPNLIKIAKQERINFIFNKYKAYEIQENPLLQSFGKSGRDTISLLSQIENIYEINSFVTQKNNSLLHSLQNDILKSKNYGLFNKTNTHKRILNVEDKSLCFYICCTKQREVEILYKNLLSMIIDDPLLSACDIIVMMPDINHYAVIIQSIFGNKLINKNLPFTISDRKIQYMYPLALTFINLLKLPSGYFTSEKILELLEVSNLNTKNPLNIKDMQLLQFFIKKYNLCLELDEDTLNKAIKLFLDKKLNNMCKLIRLLSIYKINHCICNNLHNYLNINTLSIFDYLIKFLIKLQFWKKNLPEKCTLHNWKHLIYKMIRNFFNFDTEVKKTITLLQNFLQSLSNKNTIITDNHQITITLLYNFLFDFITKKIDSTSFFTGGINFCTLTKMRSVPAKVICLLGMNDNSYPRRVYIDQHNLMIKKFRYGDYNTYESDRYIFLEILLFARQKLYISFLSDSILNNIPNYPSSVVHELNNYIVQNFRFSGYEYIDEIENFKKIELYLWNRHTNDFFSCKKSFIKEKVKKFKNKSIPFIKISNTNVHNGNFFKPLNKFSVRTISIEDLLNFYKNPIRTFFQKRLKIIFPKIKSQNFKKNNIYSFDTKINYQINEKLLYSFLKKKNSSETYTYAHINGFFPYGSFSELDWINQYNKIKSLSEKINKWYLPERKNKNIFLKFKNVVIQGTLENIQSNGLIRWSFDQFSIRNGLLLWIEHLIYCATGGTKNSQMFSKNKSWCFHPYSEQQSIKYLFFLISGYFEGMTSPLLLNKSSEAWFNYCFDQKRKNLILDPNVQKKAQEKILQTWYGNEYFVGEKNDIYLNKIINTLDEKSIQSIIFAAKKYFLLPCMLNQS